MSLRVLLYTYGTGSGHLARVNAVCKGLLRAVPSIDLSVVAPRTKYARLVEPRAQLIVPDCVPDSVDVLVCDWKADEYVESFARDYARLYVGLRRLGKIPSRFPDHYRVVSVEPRVRSETAIWPIISTFRDELATVEEFERIVGTSEPVTLLCENGAYASHPNRVFSWSDQWDDSVVVRCSNSPHVAESRDLDYWPVARLFPHAHRIVIGAGYNSIHEALAFADLDRVFAIRVGGDDQEQRLRHYRTWADECKRDSASEDLANWILSQL